jgi:hypothetical protein
MHGVLAAARVASRKSADQLADQTVSDDEEDWFPRACRQLLPKDAGLALHLTTGFEERTCYRYAAGDRKPPAYFLRALLRSEHGWQWLCAVMEGSEARWLDDIQRGRRIAEAINKIE